MAPYHRLLISLSFVAASFLLYTSPVVADNCGSGENCGSLCCSQFGFCGSTSDYCGTGCNPNGGTCPSAGGCGTGPNCGTQCCSEFGYCGTTSDYCGAGCDSEGGTCSASSPTPTDYNSSPNPADYDSAPTPTDYSSPTPNDYNSSPTPIDYNSSPTPTDYNSSPNPTDSGSPEIDACLTAHNDARAEVGVEPLVWDANVASTAQSWANTLGADCSFTHGGDVGLGQNLYKRTGGSLSWAEAAQGWINEKALYAYDVFPDGCSGGWENCGNYTQVIWNDTKTVGCGSSQCADGSIIVVCDYNPPGNFEGQYPY
eukprot:TRINITY_DN688_c0_g2_i10.p1 TRINITY_DN688_c0_g2~~TRINITY_DN688_c0_g2_i10.p1  ORF type:complete len:313 (+),score=8.09 TRINITY_DN688_c0_g2_i10:418-1356(+)